MIDMMACVQTDSYQLEVLRRIALAFLAVSLGVWLLLHYWRRSTFGDVSPHLLERCHKGYGWADIDRVYSVVGKDKLESYGGRYILGDSIFALLFGIATVITGVWAFEDGCRSVGERWFALSLILIGLLAMLFNWLENGALKRTALAWRDAVEGRQTDLQESLARTASNRTVAKAWLFMLAVLQCLWFHVTSVVGGVEVAMALLCGLIAGV
ncbi:MAG: hypothetical protein ACRCYS_08495, partial [Beijerinckiaceae bacterium]